jgi:PhoPQ-activated pathogenicity-related protein
MGVELGMVAAAVYQVPNQPLIFSSDPLQHRRSEDAILALSWHQYMENFNPEWVARLPMTKAAVRYNLASHTS